MKVLAKTGRETMSQQIDSHLPSNEKKKMLTERREFVSMQSDFFIYQRHPGAKAVTINEQISGVSVVCFRVCVRHSPVNWHSSSRRG